MKSSIAPGFRPSRPRLPAVAVVFAALLCAGAPAWAQADAASTVAPQRSDPRQVSATVAQVQALKRDGKSAEALAVLEAALKQAPRDAQLRFLYGVTVAEAGRASDAIAVFEALTADFPELPEPHNNLAVMHAAAGELEKARSALENAVRALPGYALAHENLGDLYLRMAAREWELAGRADARNRSAGEKLAMAREMLQRITPPKPAAPGTRTPATPARP